MRRIHAATGDPPLRDFRRGFEGLARVVVGQQLSIASAAAIWARTRALAEPFDAHRFAGLTDQHLKSAGLSRGKMITLRALAGAVTTRRLDLDALDTAADTDIHAALTAVHGIGPWTADIYLLFCLGRADAWPSGDLALKIATTEALGLAERPTTAELEDISERWRPWRALAARLLWAFYALPPDQRRRIARPRQNSYGTSL